MLKLRINPIVVKDLKNIRDYIAEDNEEYAAKTIKEIYGKFENLQMFPGMGSDLSKRVSFLPIPFLHYMQNIHLSKSPQTVLNDVINLLS